MDRLNDVLSDSGFETFYQGHPDAIYAVTADGTFAAGNDALFALTGYSKEDLLARSLLSLIDPEDREEVRSKFALTAGGRRARFVIKGRTKSGEVFAVDIVNTPLRDRASEVVGVLGIARDINDLLRAMDHVAAKMESNDGGSRIVPTSPWSIDVTSGELRWGEELFSMLGSTSGDSSWYRNALDRFCDEPHHSDVKATLELCLAQGTSIDLVTRFHNAAGGAIDVLIRGAAVRDARGAITRVEGRLYDISVLVRQREEMVIRESPIAKNLNQIATALFFVGRDWRIAFVNRAGLALTQMSLAELQRGTVWDVVPEISLNSVSEVYRSAMENGKIGTAIEFLEFFGRYFEVTAFPTEDGIVVSVRDVHAQQEAKKKMQDYAQRVAFLAEMLDLAKDAMIVRSFDEGVMYWNKAAEELYGWSFDEVKGLRSHDLLYADPTDVEVALAMTLRDGFWAGELVQRARDGRAIYVDARFQLVRDAGGEPVAVYSVHVDITTSKHEKELRIRQQRMESIGTLAGGMAHDLNNMLTPVLMSLELLAASEADEHRRELLTSMMTNVLRGSGMVRQVLAFAKGVEGERVSVPLPVLLIELQQFCRDSLPKNIDVSFDVAKDLYSVTGDETQLMQVLVNLITNARDAMPHGGPIVVRARNVTAERPPSGSVKVDSRRWVILEVSDVGTGINEATLARMFEPFFTTKEFGMGSGLGLSTSQAIVESHGGFMDVESTLGSGTNFKVWLPGEESVDTVDELGDLVVAAQLEGQSRRLLVVDDEDVIVMMLREVLRSSGFHVDTAQNGQVALDLMKQQPLPYDVIVTDLNMPSVNGLEFANYVRERHDRAKFIFMSGLSDSAALLGPDSSEPIHFLQKPFTIAQLLELIEETLGDE